MMIAGVNALPDEAKAKVLQIPRSRAFGDEPFFFKIDYCNPAQTAARKSR
jgi:hypothetical protein